MLKEVFRELMEQFFGRNKNVEVNNIIYQELEELALQENLPVNYYVNNLLRETIDSKKKSIIDREKWIEEQQKLIPYYQFLDRYLYATLDNKIEIGITNDLAGRETAQDFYTLQDYSLNKRYRNLNLQLTKGENSYPISFHEIEDIKFLDLNDCLKVWIYMPHKTWRFYLYFDKKSLIENNESGKLELE